MRRGRGRGRSGGWGEGPGRCGGEWDGMILLAVVEDLRDGKDTGRPLSGEEVARAMWRGGVGAGGVWRGDAGWEDCWAGRRVV